MTAWKHVSLKDCDLAVGRVTVKLGPEGHVIEPSPDALALIEKWNTHAGFILDVEPDQEETQPPAPIPPPAHKAKRRGRPRKVREET